MNAYVGQPIVGFESVAAQSGADHGNVTSTPWGYIVVGDGAQQNRVVRSVLARFFGMALFLCGLFLGLMPETGATSAAIAMKLSVMVIFMLFGGVLVWAGRKRPGVELHVDQRHALLRIGGRDMSGEFKPADVLRFEDVQSVYLMREEGTQPKGRLFLRLDPEVAVEIADGSFDAMDRLRARLTYDLTSGATHS